MPQPRRQTVSRLACLETLAQLISLTTVYSENVDVPMKWCSGVPSADTAKREVPSGIAPAPCVPRILGQRFVLGERQKMHSASLHCGV